MSKPRKPKRPAKARTTTTVTQTFAPAFDADRIKLAMLDGLERVPTECPSGMRHPPGETCRVVGCMRYRAPTLDEIEAAAEEREAVAAGVAKWEADRRAETDASIRRWLACATWVPALTYADWRYMDEESRAAVEAFVAQHYGEVP